MMSGVFAGVISIAEDRTIRPHQQLGRGAAGAGRAADRPPADGGVARARPLAVGRCARGDGAGDGEGEGRTFAVRITPRRHRADPDLRRHHPAADRPAPRRWADVARRMAHEIKNPLARSARSSSSAVMADSRWRRNADLRAAYLHHHAAGRATCRMVDEFSSFARMPKPVFREESLVDVARQTMFLHEVAHPGIRFALDHADPGPTLVCDRRQLGKLAAANIVNAVEEDRRGSRRSGRVRGRCERWARRTAALPCRWPIRGSACR
ncbi:hypothetical protein AB5I41_05260 [Sphingomonas sp. MMS24-JH45]